MHLNFQTYGAGFPLLILHGLFGSSDNWQSVGRKLGESYQVFALDLRNHGRSPHSNLINYEVMAADVAEFMAGHQLSRAHLLGHSMGGKVAMQFALLHPDNVHKLIIADIAPKAYPPSHLTILAALGALDLSSFRNRNDIDAALAPDIPELAVRQFLLKNLARDDAGHFQWKLNLPAIDAHYSELISGIESDRPFPGPALFISGAQSNYMQESDRPLVTSLFPHTQFKVMPGAGHWLHAEAPEQFCNAVLDFLR